jgi:hypothetical protein
MHDGERPQLQRAPAYNRESTILQRRTGAPSSPADHVDLLQQLWLTADSHILGFTCSTVQIIDCGRQPVYPETRARKLNRIKYASFIHSGCALGEWKLSRGMGGAALAAIGTSGRKLNQLCAGLPPLNDGR